MYLHLKAFKVKGGNIILMSIFKVQLQSKNVDPHTLFTRFKNLKEYELNQLNMLTPYCTFTTLYLNHKSQILPFK